MKKIILTGGGTAGHVTPNLALIPSLKENGFEIEYIGSHRGMERDLVKGIPYHGISCGKLRRYFDLQNVTDIGKIVKGIFDAQCIIKRLKPNIIFSKGGFVSVPVVIAGWLNRIPVIIHESDITQGLANKISMPFAKIICTSFPQLKLNKSVYTGTPIRRELLLNNTVSKMKYDKPVVLVIGGSSGSVIINKAVREALHSLSDFFVIHICGKGNSDLQIDSPNYLQYEYVTNELAELFCVADVIVSRAGSNSIFEFLALNKPNLLIPLSKKASRGDQILNAEAFEKQGFSKVLYEDDLTPESLAKNIHELYQERAAYKQRMSTESNVDGTKAIVDLILKHAK